jgi:hypothetical protein
VTVSGIDIRVFEVPQPIGAWRAEFQSRQTPLGQPLLKERAMAACAAVALNLGMLGALTLDASPAYERLSRRMGASSGVLEVFFIDAPRDNRSVPAAVDPAMRLRASHVALPLQLPNFNVADGAAGDAPRTAGAVATAIEPVSPEYERRRLRAVYQEHLETYLAEHIHLTPADSVAQCVVRLRQSTVGEIVDVNMTDCERGISERSALAAELQRVAALPLPPRNDVFESELLVTFGKQVKVQLASEQ